MAKDKKKGNNESKKPITKDERFKSVHNDPRFRMPNFKNLKVKVDDRFSKEELNKLSVGALGKKVKIDRYGRKINDKSNDLDKFYEHEDDNNDSNDESDDQGADDKSADDDEEEDDLEVLTARIRKEEEVEEEESDDEEEEDNATELLDRARGEGLVSSSEDEDSSSSDSDSEDIEEEEEEDSEIELEEGKPDESDPTSSFAVVNMDWDNIRAVDLMATLISFVPKGGSIKSVTIYPSEFGKERMQKEEIEGPPRDLFNGKKKKSKHDDSSDSEDIDSDIDANDVDNLARLARKLYEEDDGKEDYDSKALRRYQLQRLRYFYAVVVCDSVHTSKLIYDNCDGTEYESTANIFDLRYIPEDMEFDELEAKDSCTKIPSSYRPDSTFVTDALQHSKVKLTWDETPKERLTLSSRPLSQKEIEENDFKAYLASDSDGSDAENDSSLKDKYQSLLGQTFTKFGKENNNNGDDVDMEITFDPGLKDKSNEDDDEEQEKEKEETTIEAYRRKEKERRQKRLAKFKESKLSENGNEELTKPSKSKKSAKNKKHAVPEMDEKSKAELELVMMDNQDADTKDHFNMKDVIKSEKQKKNKKSKKSKNIDEEMVQDNFVANLNDPRFKEIFENHDYAIDPTNSEFKKTETMKKILKERAIRNKGRKNKSNNNDKSSKRKATEIDNKDNVRSLADKLKKKQKRY